MGRVLLRGGAAHVSTPAGGQGMNTGIQDAIALASAASEVLEGKNEHALVQYAFDRRPVAERVISLADRLTRAATASCQMRPIRNAFLRAMSHFRPFRSKLTMRLAGLASLVIAAMLMTAGACSAQEVLTLDQAVSMALENNRGLRNSDLDREKALDKLRANRAYQFPSIKLYALGAQ